MSNGLTVAIVTARKLEETSYLTWIAQTPAVMRDEVKGAGFEWKALLCLLASAFRRGPIHHVYFQLEALAHQTEPPDKVLIVDRCLTDPTIAEATLDMDEWPFEVRWTQPMIWGPELAHSPLLGTPQHITTDLAAVLNPPARDRTRPWGCADKNSAIVLCDTPYLMMLDDCCIPGYTCCETALGLAKAGKIGMLRHHKLYLPKGDNPRIERADANLGPNCAHFVLGIWCMPMQFILDVNGFNTELDGRHADWDAELLKRMRAYAAAKEVQWGYDERARVYEIEHERPWSDVGEPVDWEKGWWKAPGPCLRDLREVNAVHFARITRADTEAEEDEEDSFED